MSWLFGLLKGTVAVAGVAGGLYAAGSRLMDDAQTLSVELEAAMAREGRKQQMLNMALDGVHARTRAALAALLPTLRARLLALTDMNAIVAEIKQLSASLKARGASANAAGGGGGGSDAAIMAGRIEALWEEAKLRAFGRLLLAAYAVALTTAAVRVLAALHGRLAAEERCAAVPATAAEPASGSASAPALRASSNNSSVVGLRHSSLEGLGPDGNGSRSSSGNLHDTSSDSTAAALPLPPQSAGANPKAVCWDEEAEAGALRALLGVAFGRGLEGAAALVRAAAARHTGTPAWRVQPSSSSSSSSAQPIHPHTALPSELHALIARIRATVEGGSGGSSGSTHRLPVLDAMLPLSLDAPAAAVAPSQPVARLGTPAPSSAAAATNAATAPAARADTRPRGWLGSESPHPLPRQPAPPPQQRLLWWALDALHSPPAVHAARRALDAVFAGVRRDTNRLVFKITSAPPTPAAGDDGGGSPIQFQPFRLSDASERRGGRGPAGSGGLADAEAEAEAEEAAAPLAVAHIVMGLRAVADALTAVSPASPIHHLSATTAGASAFTPVARAFTHSSTGSTSESPPDGVAGSAAPSPQSTLQATATSCNAYVDAVVVSPPLVAFCNDLVWRAVLPT